MKKSSDKRKLTGSEKEALLAGLDWQTLWNELHRVIPGNGLDASIIRELQRLNDIQLRGVLKSGIEFVEDAYQKSADDIITASFGPFLIVREPRGARLQLTMVENELGDYTITQAGVYGKVTTK